MMISIFSLHFVEKSHHIPLSIHKYFSWNIFRFQHIVESGRFEPVNKDYSHSRDFLMCASWYVSFPTVRILSNFDKRGGSYEKNIQTYPKVHLL